MSEMRCQPITDTKPLDLATQSPVEKPEPHGAAKSEDEERNADHTQIPISTEGRDGVPANRLIRSDSKHVSAIDVEPQEEQGQREQDRQQTSGNTP